MGRWIWACALLIGAGTLALCVLRPDGAGITYEHMVRHFGPDGSIVLHPPGAGAGGGYSEVTVPPPPFDIRHPQALFLEVDYWRVDAACRAIFKNLTFTPYRLVGCAEVRKRRHERCLGVIPRADGQVISRSFRDAVADHEHGHCNGWPAEHPGGRWRRS